jgi:hypothetical protein
VPCASARIAANDREVEYINAHAMPRNHGRLLSAELVARGLLGYVNNGVITPRLSEIVVLPE